MAGGDAGSNLKELGFWLEYDPEEGYTPDNPIKIAGTSWTLEIDYHHHVVCGRCFIGKVVCQNLSPKQMLIQATLTLATHGQESSQQITFKNDHSEILFDDLEALSPFKVLVNMESVRYLPDFENRFSASDSVNNTSLEVEGKTVYVNKEYLSFISPFFHTLFNANFREKNEGKFPLTDITKAQLEELLHVIYPSNKPIDKTNVNFLLKFGDRYQIESVVKKCEQFLLDDEDLSGPEKLVLSDKYRLEELQVNALLQMSKADIHHLRSREEMKAFSNDSLLRILDHYLALG